MIITYGAFCSQTLDKNYIPIVLKYLELYVLTYSLDDVLSELSKNSNKTFVKAGKNTKSYRIKAESENLIDGEEKEIIELQESDLKIIPFLNLTEQRAPGSGTGNKPQLPSTDNKPHSAPNSGTGTSSRPSFNTGNAGTGNHPSSVNPTKTSPKNPRPNTSPTKVYTSPPEEPKTKVGDINRAVVSVEPTWLQVTYNDSTFMLGIKVIPIFFKDEETIVNEIMNDLSYSASAKLLFQQFKRTVVGGFRRWIENSIGGKIADSLGWEIFDKNQPQGIKIKNKVIYATTSFGKNLFMVLNKNSFSDDISNKTFKYMYKSLKWCSLIFMDDVNQQVSFCMKIHKGACSVVPYRVLIHSTLNKTMGQAYQDIDEVQNAVSSVFKLHPTRITKIFGEMEAAYSLIDIRTHLIEHLYLQENTERYLTNPDLAIEMFKKIRFISKSSNLEDMQSKLQGFPTKTPEQLNAYINKNSKNFKKLYNFAHKVLKNSISFDISDNDLQILAYILAYRSANMRGPNQLPRLRDILKNFVYSLRKNEKIDLDKKVIIFRTLVDVFNTTTNVLKYHDYDSDEERQDIILRNLYVFLSLAPLLVLQ